MPFRSCPSSKLMFLVIVDSCISLRGPLLMSSPSGFTSCSTSFKTLRSYGAGPFDSSKSSTADLSRFCIRLSFWIVLFSSFTSFLCFCTSNWRVCRFSERSWSFTYSYSCKTWSYSCNSCTCWCDTWIYSFNTCTYFCDTCTSFSFYSNSSLSIVFSSLNACTSNLTSLDGLFIEMFWRPFSFRGLLVKLTADLAELTDFS